MRAVAASAAAIAEGLVNIASGRDAGHRVQLTRGDLAPDFELLGSDGQRYRLHDFKDRETVVMAWFPKAFTGGCTKECESLGSNGHALRGFKVRFFAASVDAPGTNREFAESLGIDYPIL